MHHNLNKDFTDLKGKVALVTGSTSGIGLAIADKLARHGANIIVNGLASTDEVNNILETFKSYHKSEIRFSDIDLKNIDQIETGIAKELKHFGHIDILINNAGVQYVAPIEQFPVQKWNDIIAIDLSAAFHTIRCVLPFMQKKNYGRIINIASVHGLVASMHKAAYVAAKHGIIGLTKVVALETATYNIACNSICPGWVMTPLVLKQIEDRAKNNKTSIKEETLALVGEKHPNERANTPEEIADFAYFLAEQKTNCITGSALTIDGGWTAR